jgi:3-oxoadipate enol-lactonase
VSSRIPSVACRPPQVRFIAVPDRVLRCEDSGRAGTGEAVVFLHALGCDLGLWDSVVGDFRADHRVVRYDLRGHGLSDCGPEICAIEDHADDLRHLLDRLEIHSATLVGLSVGGLVAMAAALRFPPRIRRLVICAVGSRSGTPAGWAERIASVQTVGLEGMADAVVARWFAPDFAAREPAWVRGYRNRLVRTAPSGYLATCAALRDADLTAAVAKIAVPTLVVSGECDQASPPELGRALAARIPSARWALIAGSGHLPAVERPAEFSAEVRRFLEEAP